VSELSSFGQPLSKADSHSCLAQSHFPFNGLLRATILGHEKRQTPNYRKNASLFHFGEIRSPEVRIFHRNKYFWVHMSSTFIDNFIVVF